MVTSSTLGVRSIQRVLLDHAAPIKEHQDGRARSDAHDTDVICCIPFPRMSAVAIPAIRLVSFPHHLEL